MNKKSLCTFLIGVGLVLFVWHINIFNSNPIPSIGIGLLVLSTITVINSNKKIELGQKVIWIPMAIISASIIFSGVEAIIERRMNGLDSIAIVSFGIIFFGLYLASLQLGKDIFKWMPYVVVIESVSIPIVSYFKHWFPTGGLLSLTNYDIATGLIIFGILVSPKRMWWWLATIGGTGLVFSGSGEAILSGAILLLIALISKVTWWKWAIPVSSIMVTSIILMPLGIFTSVQAPNMQRLATAGEYFKVPNQTFWQGEKAKADAIVATPPESKIIDQVLGYRITHFQISPIKPFGYGLNINRFYWGIPHNIVLIIIEQVGIVAMLAWLFVIGIGIKDKSTRVLFIGFLSLGLVDHYLFTQAFPWMPCLVGAYLGRSKVDSQTVEC